MGLLTRPHGLRGEVLMQVITAYPEHLASLSTLYLRGKLDDEYTPHDLIGVRQHKHGLLMSFDGIASREMAEDLRDLRVYVHIDDAVPLAEGEYYLFQLVGLRVVTDEGLELGHLADVMETGANDVYVIRTAEGKDILLPAIPQVIQKVDIGGGVMTVHLLDGLI